MKNMRIPLLIFWGVAILGVIIHFKALHLEEEQPQQKIIIKHKPIYNL